ncbi:MAG: capping complex subunit for YIEGIA [Syntrophomonadaceae bacterium]|nr:hypothetical protein [Bacillota bacterium]NLM88871.1 hypothetical protein [Syntrophomonadaceae bacterium]HAA09774.1 hypothetical protein [Syntrophomonas sp.]HQA50644.1 hypothetical protein [Syntrophomonadaceae bacterium]HQD91169.1 hypothetical protein [Syntrophomonadaceae bacterium]
MDAGLKEVILAIITWNPDKVKGGGCPVFYAQDQKEMEKTALLLARILGGMVHDLENDVYIIVKH